MKTIKYIFFVAIAGMLMTACLKRDNPLDEKNNAGNANPDPNANGKAQIVFDSWSFQDINQEYVLTRGITNYISVLLKNSGSAEAKGVKASFSTTNSYVGNFSPKQVSFGNIKINEVKRASGGGENPYASTGSPVYISFSVSGAIPNGTQIPINISIVDDSGNTWTDSFNVPVE